MDAYIYTFVTPYVNDHNYGDEINYACSSHTSMRFLENFMMSVPSKCFFLWIPNYWFHVCFWILDLRLQMALASCIARFMYYLSSLKSLYLKTYLSNVCSHTYRTHPYYSYDHIHVLYNVPRMKNPLVIWNHGEVEKTNLCSLGK